LDIAVTACFSSEIARMSSDFILGDHSKILPDAMLCSRRLGPITNNEKENRMRCALLLSSLLFSHLAFGQIPFPPSQPQAPITTFSHEADDWGIEPQAVPKRPPYYNSPTPVSIPGGRVIKTLELKALLDSRERIAVIDVSEWLGRMTVPGAYWIPGAGKVGAGAFYAAERERLETVLEKLTEGDKNRPVIFLGLNSESWLAYNASLHAIQAGYTDVIWYRGGISAWTGANLNLKKANLFS
jgi:PQQ-dependent catabolism-associated CXXCW motif protein